MIVTTTVKDVMRTALYRCGVLGGWHRWRNRQALTVLMFHRVLPADDPAFVLADREFTFTLDGFRRALDFVQRHYNVISLAALQAARQEGASLPPTPLLITFDDGWRDTLMHALPELKRRSLPAVLFLASEVVDLDGLRWWQDALVAALAEPGAQARLCAAAGWAETPKGNFSQALAAHLGGFPEIERRAWLAQHAPAVLGQVAQRQMLTLRELEGSDTKHLVIGGHGHTHSPLTLCADPRAELLASQRMLGALSQGLRSMSFPHGAWSSDLVTEARSCGFEWIFTSDAILADVSHLDKFAPIIGRIHVPENKWTCREGVINYPCLATYLFFRRKISR